MDYAWHQILNPRYLTLCWNERLRCRWREEIMIRHLRHVLLLHVGE